MLLTRSEFTKVRLNLLDTVFELCSLSMICEPNLLHIRHILCAVDRRSIHEQMCDVSSNCNRD